MNLKSKPILGYWNIRGLGAPIRYLLYYLGVDFEDKQYPYGPAPEYSRDAWMNEKFTLGIEMPNLPYLIDDEIRMSESVAIMKYICMKWNKDLVNPDPVTFARTEMLQDKVTNLKIKSTLPCYQGSNN